MKHTRLKHSFPKLLEMICDFRAKNWNISVEMKMKMRMLERILEGEKTEDVAKSCGISARQLRNWLHLIDDSGIAALGVRKSVSARATKIPPEIMDELKELISKPANEANENYYCWDGVTLSHLLHEKYEIEYSVRSCQILYRKLGFSYIRPQILPNREPDNEKREEYLKNLERVKSDENAVLFYSDEVHFYQQTTVTRGWYKKGCIPRVYSYPGRQSVTYFGFVGENGEFYYSEFNIFNCGTTITSIKDFVNSFYSNIQNKGKKIVIVLDNASYHHKAINMIMNKVSYEEYLSQEAAKNKPAKESKKELKDKENTGWTIEDLELINDNVEFIWLAPYSPDLNVIEQVWRLTRKHVTHNHFFGSLGALKEAINNYFDKHKEANVEFANLMPHKRNPNHKKPEIIPVG